LWIQNRRD